VSKTFKGRSITIGQTPKGCMEVVVCRQDLTGVFGLTGAVGRENEFDDVSDLGEFSFFGVGVPFGPGVVRPIARR
jgi:hypothetical protein